MSARTPLGAGAVVMTTASRMSAVMIDISSSGAGLAGCVPPQRGRDVQLRVGGYTLFGQVVWRRDETFGVKFEEALTDDEWTIVDAAIREVGEQKCMSNCEVTLLVNRNDALSEQ
ncbi:PilZ domain-containing protein [Erythrobacter sp. sf7]|uniref:PilZ domain-containing protein n=1 Tax=Erythrobacter fulvus TaxID=2987523 RepID=A0ABT5JV45_9SPHN|nr:PilZ domain-containing protein [Erythrobacter fulvus]MDC8755936.1 PilZ domain-containing protein [Erythrobacter fulvus]